MTIKITLNSLDLNSLKIFKQYVDKNFKNLNLNFQIVNLPIIKKRITLLKSPHVYKTAREQFELKRYKTIIIIANTNLVNIKQIVTFLENKPKNIQLCIKTQNI